MQRTRRSGLQIQHRADPPHPLTGSRFHHKRQEATSRAASPTRNKNVQTYGEASPIHNRETKRSEQARTPTDTTKPGDAERFGPTCDAEA